MRVKGDNVFPGYRDNDAATRDAFDEDGYYRIGDAGYLLDENDPLQGVVFNGRVAEDFKLTSGTWVSVGTLRVKVVSALAPLRAGRGHHRPRPQRDRRAGVPDRSRRARCRASRWPRMCATRCAR